MPPEVRFDVARRAYHALLGAKALVLDKGVPSNADRDNRVSKEIAAGILKRAGMETSATKLPGQTAGKEFELATAQFLRDTFTLLTHLRPGIWHIERIGDGSRNQSPDDSIARFEQYRHLTAIAQAVQANPELAASLGNDYIIKPDIVLFRMPASDDEINRNDALVNDAIARLTSLRECNGGGPLLHASVSCKLTIRSDRSQNSRSEALNLIRNRRGKLPHVVVVTAEPLPSRLASVALGNGDIDCVYHFALPELYATVKDLKLADSEESLHIMVEGRRLKDIADLPLDLAV